MTGTDRAAFSSEMDRPQPDFPYEVIVAEPSRSSTTPPVSWDRCEEVFSGGLLASFKPGPEQRPRLSVS
jgi:hypothetical protein